MISASRFLLIAFLGGSLSARGQQVMTLQQCIDYALAHNLTIRQQDVARRRPEVLQEIFLVPEEFDLPAVTMDRYVSLNRPFYPRFSQEVLEECLADFDLPADLHLGEDFDERILAQVERPSVKARRLPMRRRMMPLFKAAAVVAVMLSLGTVAQHSFDRSRQTDYNYDAYQDTYTDPQSAYGTVSEALQIVSESFQKSQVHDSDSVADTAPKQAVQ